MSIVIIRWHNGGTELLTIRDDQFAALAVEHAQKRSNYFQMYKQLPACTWKIAESTNLVGAMIESVKIPGGKATKHSTGKPKSGPST